MQIEAGNSPQASPELPRIWIFVDYWNFQLSLGIRFKVDWGKFGPWLAEKAAEAAGIASGEYSYEGMSVYSSYDPNGNGAHYRWATGWLTSPRYQCNAARGRFAVRRAARSATLKLPFVRNAGNRWLARRKRG